MSETNDRQENRKADCMLRFENVRKAFGEAQVLDGLSFDIRQGEIFVILGPSGTGKSVTLKHMVRLLTPDEGNIYVRGDCVNAATGSDLERIRDRATNRYPHSYPFENIPHRHPEGIDWVLVNGVPVLADGEHTGELPGRVLLRR